MRRTVEDPAWPRGRHGAVLERDLSVDHDERDASRVLVRLVEGGFVANSFGIEDHDVGLHPLPKYPAVRQAEALSRVRRHLANRILERHRLEIADVSAEHARKRSIAARMWTRPSEQYHLPIRRHHRCR